VPRYRNFCMVRQPGNSMRAQIGIVARYQF
jgi:hypothetical protein